MIELLFVAALTFGSSTPCVVFETDCDQGEQWVLLEIRTCANPYNGAPYEWTAFPICPPNIVKWCPVLSPPYAITWITYDRFFNPIQSNSITNGCP